MTCNSTINTLSERGGGIGGASTQMACNSAINMLPPGGGTGGAINANDL